MMPRPLADRFRQARIEFLEARAAGCSIPELRHRKALERIEQRMARRAGARANADAACGTATDFTDFNAPWMMRN